MTNAERATAIGIAHHRSGALKTQESGSLVAIVIFLFEKLPVRFAHVESTPLIHYPSGHADGGRDNLDHDLLLRISAISSFAGVSERASERIQ